MTTTRGPDPHPDLFALVRSELSTTDAIGAGDHLDGCPSCREELVDMLVGHSVLTRAVRTVRSTAPLTDPWEAHELPVLTPPRRRVRGTALLAAAALVVGATVVGALTLRDDDAPSEQAPLAAPEQVATLDAVEGSAAGEVRMVRDEGGTLMTISAPDLPGAGSGRFYQAWLLDPATDKMLPLGLVSGDSTTFRVDDDLLSSYDAVDVSLEVDDGDPEHSVTSVLRGSYEPPV